MPRQQQQSIYDIFQAKQFQDDIGRRLVIESILNLDLDQNQLEGTLNPQQIQLLRQHRDKKDGSTFINKGKNAGRSTIQAIKSKPRKNKNDFKGDVIEEQPQEDYADYDDDIQQGKRFRQFMYIEPPRFKLLGYSKQNKPIFKISDVFLTSDPVMRSIIDKQFNQIIYGRSHGSSSTISKLETGQLSKKYEKQYNFEELIQAWEKKEYEDVFTSNNKKNKMDQAELEQVVVNRGDQKDNYWIYKVGDRNGCTWGDLQNKKHDKKQKGSCTQKLNYILTNPKFKDNMYKVINHMRLQYANIEQFEDEEDLDEEQNHPDKNEQKNNFNPQKMVNDGNQQRLSNEEQEKNDEVEQEFDNDEPQQDQQQDEKQQGQGHEQNADKQEDNDFKGDKNNKLNQDQQQQSNFDKYGQILKQQRRKEQQQKQRKKVKSKEKVVEREEKNVMILDDIGSVDMLPPQYNLKSKEVSKLWGQVREPINSSQNKSKSSALYSKCQQTKYELQEEEIIKQSKNSKNQSKNKANQPIQQNRSKIIVEEERSLVDEIIKDYSLINKNIIYDTYQNHTSIHQYNRIQFHLENPDFFSTKLHSALQKKSQHLENLIHGVPQIQNNQHMLNLTRNLSNPSALNRSMISGSLNTGNQGTLRMSNQQQNYMMGTNMLDEDHESIEQKILKQMNHHSRKPITHSQVATKLLFIKFSTDVEQFGQYHRHQFKYEVHFGAANKNKVKIHLLRHNKPLKNKTSELNINIEKLDSHKKFMKAQALSLASEDLKQYIIVQYIEQNPLLMSDIGMCQRMMLQINNQQMLQNINSDIINIDDIDILEQRRDRNNKNTVSTEKKMELWRKNIKQEFGDNGKVYLWQPKRQSKTIGNPEGLGVAVMESNLANIPIVKQNTKKTDFLLVREGNKWVLRKIDAIYTSGQVEPKQIVYTPDNRHYQSFLQNYQRDFIKKYALKTPDHKILIDDVKRYFPNTPQTSAESRLRKILKNKMKATTKDNKNYQIPIEDGQIMYLIKPEDYCLYQRMQKSLHQLAEVGITQMKNMEKMKSILRKYFRKNVDSLKKFTVARIIRDQLQLTSWYLTQSFSKFMDKKARIEMTGHADPTKGHGGYSYIKKPQKERTDKDQAQKKQEKQKLSGTQFDLRKLRAENSIQFLLQKGYTREQVENKTRWQLVSYIKKEKDTEYARKQRETKQEKEENQRKERSKLFNILLRNLKLDEQQAMVSENTVLIQPYQYGYSPFYDLDYYMERQKVSWVNSKENYERKKNQDGEADQADAADDDDDDDS